jgi:hypothetical protein
MSRRRPRPRRTGRYEDSRADQDSDDDEEEVDVNEDYGRDDNNGSSFSSRYNGYNVSSYLLCESEILMIPVCANRQTSHSPRKLATNMISIPGLAENTLTHLLNVNYQSARCQARMATPRKFTVTIPGPNYQTARQPTANTGNNPRPIPRRPILKSFMIVTTITGLKNSQTNMTALKTGHWIALMIVMMG